MQSPVLGNLYLNLSIHVSRYEILHPISHLSDHFGLNASTSTLKPIPQTNIHVYPDMNHYSLNCRGAKLCVVKQKKRKDITGEMLLTGPIITRTYPALGLECLFISH